MEPLTFGIIIPARYASTRFPGKPLSLIAGKPMIVRTVEAALACNPTVGVAVATDDERIADAVSHLVPIVMTRSDHQTGTDRIAEAYEKLQWECDIVVNLPIQWGHRRVLFDNLCWDYHMGIGFNVLNTGNASVAYFEDGTSYDDHEAVVHSMVLQPLAWGRIFHGGLGLSYLF